MTEIKPNYSGLWHLLKSKGLMKSDLHYDIDLNFMTIAKMTNREYVSLKTLQRICEYLDCTLDDICFFDEVSLV